LKKGEQPSNLQKNIAKAMFSFPASH